MRLLCVIEHARQGILLLTYVLQPILSPNRGEKQIIASSCLDIPGNQCTLQHFVLANNCDIAFQSGYIRIQYLVYPFVPLFTEVEAVIRCQSLL
jgi:hypothetical protein